MKRFRRSWLLVWSACGTACATAALSGCGDESSTPVLTNAQSGTADLPVARPAVETSPGTTPQASPSPQATVNATIKQNSTGLGSQAYDPNPLVITVGTTVRWVNQDPVPHSVTSMTGLFTSGTLNQGQEYTHTFNEAGTFPYYCTIHGFSSMNGTVEVRPQPSGSP